MAGSMDSAPYLRVLAKLQWAEEHIKNLNATTDRFRKAHPDIVAAEPHEDLGEIWHKVAYVPSIPDPLALMLGDALYNLRAALDYLAHQLVVVAGNEPNGQTAFPIFDTADEYWERMGRKVKGMRQPAMEAINRIQPYEGGFGHTLWQLHRLNNIDKHRVLLTIALINSGRTMTPSEEQQFAERFRRVHGAYPTGTSRWRFLRGKEFPVPLNADYILLKVPISEAQEDMRFGFDIAFNERDVPAGTTVFVLLRMMSDQVFEVLRSMGPHLQ
jgi:hypothetical protein